MKKISNNTIGYITLVLLLSATSAFSLNLYFQQRTARDKLDIRAFPYEVGEWRGKDLEITEEEYRILETRNLILREYVKGANEKLSLFIVYSETNRSVFHPPEVCLIGSGIRIIDKKSETIDSCGYNFSVNKMYTEKGNFRGIVLYCYKAGNLYTENYYLQQAYFAINQLLRRRQGGATIRVSMPIREDTLATLKTFLVKAVETIDSLPVD